jgi:hypothetical protein
MPMKPARDEQSAPTKKAKAVSQRCDRPEQEVLAAHEGHGTRLDLGGYVSDFALSRGVAGDKTVDDEGRDQTQTAHGERNVVHAHDGPFLLKPAWRRANLYVGSIPAPFARNGRSEVSQRL